MRACGKRKERNTSEERRETVSTIATSYLGLEGMTLWNGKDYSRPGRRDKIGADDRPVRDGTPTLNSNLGEVFCSVLSTGKTLSIVVHGKDIPMSSSVVNWM